MSKQKVTLEEVNEILSSTLLDVVEKKITLRQAKAISHIGLALSKNIIHLELQKRVEFLEQILKKIRN